MSPRRETIPARQAGKYWSLVPTPWRRDLVSKPDGSESAYRHVSRFGLALVRAVDDIRGEGRSAGQFVFGYILAPPPIFGSLSTDGKLHFCVGLSELVGRGLGPIGDQGRVGLVEVGAE